MKSTDLKSNNLQEVWRNFKGGDFASLGILFETHYKELFYYGIKIAGMPELVKDTIQDLFANVWERRNKMAQVENFKAYLIISLRRELIRRINKTRNESSVYQFAEPQFSFSVEDFLISDEENLKHSKILAHSMEGLTERQREVILLRFYHDLEFPEISLVLEMNIQSVRNLLFRALDHIRKDLSGHGLTGAGNIEMFLWTLFGIKK
ncbi:MAG TPA: sigma-70 family RNA polymerase sigma factor [Prolixibacteraceae bacterium]|nr:sigma-70 family RNA polymerase sigma factor [Prolixibacteraceae bacterium]